MRYEKADNLLQLALEMQARRSGISLQEIEQQFRVGRRTAMRMRDGILRNFPQAEEVPTGERTKRWRIPPGILNQLINFTAEELADLEAAADLMRRENRRTQAMHIDAISGKVKALMRSEVQRRIEPDLEALLEAEGLAARPGPRPRIDLTVVEQLREAIKSCSKVVIKYRTRSTGKTSQRTVHPYGFLYGHRHYLVAYNLRRGEEGYRLFSLPNISKVELKEQSFERDETFDLEVFAKQSFGVFQEQPQEVVWRFSPRAAPDAKDFIFHPDQKLEHQRDGSLIVRFRAGGLLEMAWHLYCWGDDVEVIQPEGLRSLCAHHAPHWPGLP